jgi:septal ring factor EnvC (AmiA/AmiB activator)
VFVFSRLQLYLSAVAKSEAALSRTEKNHRFDIEKLQVQLGEAKATSQQLQKSFAGVVKEKERIAAELIEVNAISQELMGIVEANGLG